MNAIKQLLILVPLLSIVLSIPLDAATGWTLFGLKDEAINTILPLDPGYGEDAIMVGTAKGIWYYEYGHGNYLWTGLPIYDMKLTGYNSIVAAAGNGSDSDGIYIGKVVAHGEPGNLWKFKLMVKCPRPTALEYNALEGSCTGKLYVGNSSGVSTGLICNDTVNGLTIKEITKTSVVLSLSWEDQELTTEIPRK